MRKKVLVTAMAVALMFNSVVTTSPVYASTTSGFVVSSMQQEATTGKVVYLTDGEGTLGDGEGTKESPYTNIRTALQNIQNGDTLRLMDTVYYTEYEVNDDGSNRPFVIDKAITIEGETEDCALNIRAQIQLEADVTFRNMKLQMIPQVSLGKLLGVPIERSTTIYLAGHSLTLDRVNTRMSTSQDQYNIRPFISGGTYRGEGKIGDKSVFRIINPTTETIIDTIYAGDYYDDIEMDLEVHLDGKMQDTVLYAGGVGHNVKGNVDIHLYGNSNLAGVSQANHEGNVNITLEEGYFTDRLSVNGIDELVLEEGARLTVPATGVFDIENVTLKNKAVIDYRYMKENPQVHGDFVGTQNVADATEAGAVLLNNKQTLVVRGEVQGLTRLNSNGIESINRFLAGHNYVQASKDSQGDFTIDGTTHTEFELVKSIENEQAVWKVEKKKASYLEQFKSFEWFGGADKIVKPQYQDQYLYPVVFINNNNEEYIPKWFDLLEDFEYQFVRADGADIDIDWEIFVDWDYESNADDARAVILLEIIQPEKSYGDFILTVTHNESGAKLERVIRIFEEDEETSEPPVENPPVENPPVENPPVENPPVENPPVENPPVENPPVGNPPVVKPSIKLNKTSGTIYTSGSTELQLKATVVGESKTVSYRSNKPKIATVDANGKVTAVSAGTATITASANGVEATCTVTVKKVSLKLNISKATIYTAGTTSVTLKPTIVGASKTVKYSSSNEKAAKVSKSGKVTAVGTGTTTITVEANGIKQKCEITVKKPELQISKTKITLKKGKTATISVKATPAGTISFTSSDKKFVKVNSRGVVTGVKVGQATITVKCNGITKKVTVTVK